MNNAINRKKRINKLINYPINKRGYNKKNIEYIG